MADGTAAHAEARGQQEGNQGPLAHRLGPLIVDLKFQQLLVPQQVIRWSKQALYYDFVLSPPLLSQLVPGFHGLAQRYFTQIRAANQ